MVDLDAVASVLAERGPLTGADLHAAVGGEVFGLWKACRNDDDFRLRRIGRRYLRLDRTVEGFARLSPSILREFLTYTVVGLPGQDEAIEAAATALEKRTVRISRLKRRTAERFITEVMSIAGVPRDSEHVCVLIAGDAAIAPHNSPDTGARIIEALASGIPTIANALATQGLPPATYIDTNIRFTVLVHPAPSRPRTTMTLNRTEQRIYDALATGPRTVAELQTELTLTAPNIRKALRNLRQHNLVHQDGGRGRPTSYRHT